MVFIDPYLNELDLVTFGDFQAHLFQDLVDLFIEDSPSILGGTNEMVDQDGYVMAFPNQLAHALILAQQAAGKCPQWIIAGRFLLSRGG